MKMTFDQAENLNKYLGESKFFKISIQMHAFAAIIWLLKVVSEIMGRRK
jgi:hypothetical protein